MKKILITGCSTGFGYDSSKYLAEKGHHVYATMRNINGKNAKAAFVLKDFADANNLNIVGTIRTAKAILLMMRAQGSGLIIQVSSTAGMAAFPGFGIYHASKRGLEGVSEALRYELAELGIEVVIVEPGPFSTNFMGNLVMSGDSEIASAYKHVMDFNDGLGKQFLSMYEDKDAPTDPMIVVEIFEKLINTPPGSRPIRTIAGLDFGFQALNDATEPIRKGALEFMGIAGWDGPPS